MSVFNGKSHRCRTDLHGARTMSSMPIRFIYRLNNFYTDNIRIYSAMTTVGSDPRQHSPLLPSLRDGLVTCLRACAALACLVRGFWAGWDVASRELRVIVSHVTRENSWCVCRCWWTSDNVKVYEAHDFELETAQFSPRQPYVIAIVLVLIWTLKGFCFKSSSAVKTLTFGFQSNSGKASQLNTHRYVKQNLKNCLRVFMRVID